MLHPPARDRHGTGGPRHIGHGDAEFARVAGQPAHGGAQTREPAQRVEQIEQLLGVANAAALGVVFDTAKRTQKHFFGHDDDITALDLSPADRITVVTGQLGKDAAYSQPVRALGERLGGAHFVRACAASSLTSECYTLAVAVPAMAEEEGW